MTKLDLKDVALLHKAIGEGDIDEVKILLSKPTFDRHYFDADNKSAAALAIEKKNDEIYELLCAKGIFIGPHERMDEITSDLYAGEKRKLRDIHRKFFKNPNLRHLSNLIKSSELSLDASSSDRREQLRLITKAFEDLNVLKSIEPILKVASTSRKLKIVFDFNRDSVEFLDPIKNRYVRGLCYHADDFIYVGANTSKEGDKVHRRYEFLGTLIHELTHFVMKLIYNNKAKPYNPIDPTKLDEFNQKRLDEFSLVVEDTAAEKESEPYIESVYDYPVSRYHAELIVRAPHLTALYKDDADKTKEVRATFFKLFDFYEKNTLVDLKREFPLMEIKHEIRELNELCDLGGIRY